MNRVLDTSVLVRYLTDDPPAMAETATQIIETAEELEVPDVVLAEAAHVLRTVYRVPREVVVDLLIEFVRRENVTVRGLEKGVVIQGLQRCRPSGRVSVPDAFIWAAARTSVPSAVYTFDERFPEEGIDIRRTAP